MILKSTFRSMIIGLRTCSVFSAAKQAKTAIIQPRCSSYTNWTLTRLLKGVESFPNQPSRQYARPSRRKPEFPSQLTDMQPSMLKQEYAAVPLAQSVDDVVKKLLSLEFASHREKLRLKEEQLIAKVQRDENDRKSPEVKVAIMTAHIRNFQEHLHKHPKDKANKRWMLMTIDSRKKKLKFLRRTRYDAFEKVCKELGITYTFPPEYYRRVTRRWLAKKAFCKKVFLEVQRQKAEQKQKEKEEAEQKAAASSTVPRGAAV